MLEVQVVDGYGEVGIKYKDLCMDCEYSSESIIEGESWNYKTGENDSVSSVISHHRTGVMNT